MTRRQRIWLGLGIFATALPLILLGAVVSDAWTRTVDAGTSLLPSAPSSPDVRTYPAPFKTDKQFSGVVIPGTPQEIGDPPGAFSEDAIVYGDDLLEWARPLGGVDLGRTTVTFSITSESTVVVEDLEVRVVERRPALRGSYVSVQGGGDLWSRVYEVDLDDDSLTVRTDLGEDGDWDLPISLGPADTYLAEVVGAAEETDTSWVIDIHYVSEGKRHTMTFDDDGEPFRTTGWKSVTHHWVWLEGWAEGPPW